MAKHDIKEVRVLPVRGEMLLVDVSEWTLMEIWDFVADAYQDGCGVWVDEVEVMEPNETHQTAALV